MKNKNVLLLLGVSLLALVGCKPSNPTKSDWSESEHAVIEQYLGEYASEINLPYYYIEGNGDIFYDEEYDCISVTGAEVTSEDLEAYASKFVSPWEGGKEDPEIAVYYFFQEFEEENEVVLIETNLYATMGEDISNDGNGTFWLDVFLTRLRDVDTIMQDILTNLNIDNPTLGVDYFNYDWEGVESYIADITFSPLGSDDFNTVAIDALNEVFSATEEDIIELSTIRDGSEEFGAELGTPCLSTYLLGSQYDYLICLVAYLKEGNVTVRIILART